MPQPYGGRSWHQGRDVIRQDERAGKVLSERTMRRRLAQARGAANVTLDVDPTVASELEEADQPLGCSEPADKLQSEPSVDDDPCDDAISMDGGVMFGARSMSNPYSQSSLIVCSVPTRLGMYDRRMGHDWSCNQQHESGLPLQVHYPVGVVPHWHPSRIGSVGR